MKLAPMFVLAAVLLGGSAALAAPPPGSPIGRRAGERCAVQWLQMGTSAFEQLYGANASPSDAFRTCVSKLTASEAHSERKAAKACKAEQADANFAKTHDGRSFEQVYGTGHKAKNAFGKCVASKARAASEAQDESTIKAAKACRAAQVANPAAFKATYGTGASKADAFGRCVSARTRGRTSSGPRARNSLLLERRVRAGTPLEDTSGCIRRSAKASARSGFAARGGARASTSRRR